MEIFTDGVNAHRNGNDYRKETIFLKNGGSLTVKLAPGGGFAAHIF